MAEKKEEPFITNREMLRDIHDKTNRMYNVVYGDEKAAIPGISHRVTELEKKERKRGGFYILVSSISAGIALGIKTIADHLK